MRIARVSFLTRVKLCWPVEVMILSEPLSSVDWKLNELLAADRRAREYAQHSGQLEEMTEQKPFAPGSHARLMLTLQTMPAQDKDGCGSRPAGRRR